MRESVSQQSSFIDDKMAGPDTGAPRPPAPGVTGWVCVFGPTMREDANLIARHPRTAGPGHLVVR